MREEMVGNDPNRREGMNSFGDIFEASLRSLQPGEIVTVFEDETLHDASRQPGAQVDLRPERGQGLRRLVAKHLPYRMREDARVPTHVVATNALTGQSICVSHGWHMS